MLINSFVYMALKLSKFQFKLVSAKFLKVSWRYNERFAFYKDSVTHNYRNFIENVFFFRKKTLGKGLASIVKVLYYQVP